MSKKPHPTQRKMGHHKPEHEDDVFVAKVIEIGNWMRARQQFLTVVLVAVAIAGASLVYYRNYRASLGTQAATQLEQIYQSISLGDPEGAKDELVVFLDRFGSTAYAPEGRMLLGQLYLEGGDAEQALAVLEPLAKSPRGPLELQAASLLAGAYEASGRWADAETTYLRVADRSELSFQVENALAGAARIRANHGNPTGAAELYERILDRLPDDAQQRGLYEMRLAEVRGTTA